MTKGWLDSALRAVLRTTTTTMGLSSVAQAVVSFSSFATPAEVAGQLAASTSSAAFRPAQRAPALGLPSKQYLRHLSHLLEALSSSPLWQQCE
jgi:hypothetical protein